MNSIYTAALAGIVSAGKVHDFMAENHLICQLCQSVFENIENDSHLERLYTHFPAL